MIPQATNAPKSDRLFPKPLDAAESFLKLALRGVANQLEFDYFCTRTEESRNYFVKNLDVEFLIEIENRFHSTIFLLEKTECDGVLQKKCD